MVLFFHNEFSEGRKDGVAVESYVSSELPKHVVIANISFKEHTMYPLGQGLNAQAIQSLLRFITSNE